MLWALRKKKKKVICWQQLYLPKVLEYLFSSFSPGMVPLNFYNLIVMSHILCGDSCQPFEPNQPVSSGQNKEYQISPPTLKQQL